MGWRSMSRRVVRMNIRKKKKKRETGAKKLISPARGPGWRCSGMAMPISRPERRFLYVQVRSQPEEVSCFSVEEGVFWRKSMVLKLECMLRTKSLTCETWPAGVASVNLKFQSSAPCEREGR